MISYHENFNLWWPDSTRNTRVDIEHALGAVRQALASSSYCKAFNTVLQAGGHVGLYPLALAKVFRRVLTCEPVPASFAALECNIRHVPNIYAHNVALSHSDGSTYMMQKDNAAVSRIDVNGMLEVRTLAIDTLDLKELDLIMLDVEDHELHALRGAKLTILQHRPIVQVEVRPELRAAIIHELNECNYSWQARVGKDLIFVPNK